MMLNCKMTCDKLIKLERKSNLSLVRDTVLRCCRYFYHGKDRKVMKKIIEIKFDQFKLYIPN